MQPITNLLIHLGWDLTWWTVLLGLSELLALATVPSVLIQRRGQPLSAISWSLALVGTPFLGVLAWWLIGRSHLERKRRKRVRARWVISRGFASFRPETTSPDEADGPFQAFKVMPEQEAAGVFPAVSDNRVSVLVDGSETYGAMERAIRSAKRHIHALFYIWEPDETGRRFRDLLCERAREGVQVRVLLDALGSRRATGRFMDPLREAGGRVGIFMPTRFLRWSLSINFRNHRKILVADGCTAYTGGLNVGDEYTRDWRDVGLLLHGPVVSQLQEVFLEDWYFATGEDLADREFLPWCGLAGGEEAGSDARCAVVASGPDAPYNATQDALFLAFTQAKRRIWITTPYLIPDMATQAALRTAVYRGVDVRLLVPARSDSAVTRLAGRSFYPGLLSGGIRIFEYKPAVLHGKSWVFDDRWAAVGTANMDTRSFRLNFEVGCFLESGEVNARLASLYERDLADSGEVTLRQLSKVGPFQQFKEAAMNLLSPLL